MDTWQYFWHRAFHVNKWLYRNIHSVHHRLYVPYSYGALYNHPVEGFILDSLGAVVSHMASFMTIRQAIVLFAFSTAKTVDDHCGFALPWDPFQFFFGAPPSRIRAERASADHICAGNNADYHDIHHQQFGIKRNFSQPYFIHWVRPASASSDFRSLIDAAGCGARDTHDAGRGVDPAEREESASAHRRARSARQEDRQWRCGRDRGRRVQDGVKGRIPRDRPEGATGVFTVARIVLEVSQHLSFVGLRSLRLAPVP